MQYTQNYHLPQWVKEDRIMMEDFNAMNGSIENGLTQTAAKADTAVSTANAAKQGADSAYSSSNKPYAVGSYVGDGTDKAIQLGFRPSCVIISGAGSHPGGNANLIANYFGFTCGGVLTDRIRLTDTGFTVLASSSGLAPDFTIQGLRYDYIAFK